SDNVLRAGLTPKHVDIPELLANTAFVPTIAEIIPGSLNKTVQHYPCPIGDFSLTAYFLKAGEKMEFTVASPSIFLMLNGSVQWKGNANGVLQGAAAFFSAPGETVFAEATADTNLFWATVPLQ
ncbi:MAG: mannose-6-phosphate isomerase, class I, partial [Chitinophagaceae bacterium]|nr:mannose-6-phosphate isomerase, class I [Chitinophagaceae bacterium]